jgi:hypothetical protein
MNVENTQEEVLDKHDTTTEISIDIDDDIPGDLDRDLQIWHQKRRNWRAKNMEEPITIEVTMTRRRWKNLADILADDKGFRWLQQELLEEIGHPTLRHIQS